MYFLIFFVSFFVFCLYVIISSNLRKANKKPKKDAKRKSTPPQLDKKSSVDTTMHRSGPLVKVELDLQRELISFQKKREFANRRSKFEASVKRKVKPLRRRKKKKLLPA